MLSQQTRRAGKRAPRRLEARGEARARDRAPQTARPEYDEVKFLSSSPIR